MNSKANLLKLTIAALALGATSLTAQAASITTNDGLNIESINGADINFEKVMGLDSGETLIEVNYRDLFQDNADDSGHWVRSEPLYLKLDLTANQQYHITTPAIYSVDDARDFIEQPEVNVQVNGQALQKVALMNQSQLLTELLIND